MKLIFCKECQDVIKLDLKERTCKCKKSGGRYLDDINAEFWGESIPMGIDNKSLKYAVNDYNNYHYGGYITAFVITDDGVCKTMKRIGK